MTERTPCNPDEAPAGFYAVPKQADYHADKAAVSKSMLSDFRYSRRLFYMKYMRAER